MMKIKVLAASMLSVTLLLMSCGKAETKNQERTQVKTETKKVETMKHDHVAILTTNYDALKNWYVEKLDFKVSKEWTVDFMPGMRLCYVSRGDMNIEIIGDLPPQTVVEDSEDPIANLKPSYNHFGINVPNMEETLSQLKAKGIEPAAPVMEIPQAGIKAAVITDIDGNVIEFIENI